MDKQKYNSSKRFLTNIDDEDFNYQIETTQNVPVPTARPTNESLSYRDQLETKIREQAKRLSELEKYKYLCEKRIKQLSPKHPLPITEAILSTNVPNDDVVNAEETKNYYDMLKKTIEIDLIKNGLLNRYINVDGVIELAKMKMEMEEYRKKLVLSTSMITALKSDVEELTRENTMLKTNTTSSNTSSTSELLKLRNDIKSLTLQNEKIIKEKNIADINVTKLQSENEALSSKIESMNEQLMTLSKNNENNSGAIAKRLRQYQSSYEKINNDLETLINEKSTLMKQNSEIVSENKLLKTKITSLQVEIDKLSSAQNAKRENDINEDYKKMYNDLLIENSNIKMLVGTVNSNNVDSNYVSQNVNEYYAKMLSENSALQIENEKIKIDLNNLNEEKENIEKELESSKIKNKNLNIEKAKVSIDNEKLIKENSILKAEIEKLKNEISQYTDELRKIQLSSDESVKSNNNLASELDEAKRKFNFINEKYTENENKIMKLQSDIKILTTERDKMKSNIIEYEKKIKAITDRNIALENDNNSIKNSESKLKQIVEATEMKVEETMQYNDKITNQLTAMERELSDKNDLIEHLQLSNNAFEESIGQKLKIFDDYVTETKMSIHSTLDTLYSIGTSFDKIANDDLNSLLSKNFSNGITCMLSQINSINNIVNYNVHLDDKLFFDTLSKFLSLLSTELESVYEKVFDSNKIAKESYSRLNTLEGEMKTKREIELNKANAVIEELKTKINNMSNDNDQLTMEVSSYKQKNYKLQKKIDKNQIEFNECNSRCNELAAKLQKSDNKVRYHEKSRRALLILISKFIKNYPYKDFARTMMEILNLNEAIAKIEIEKFLIDEKISMMNEEYATKEMNSSDLWNLVKKEFDNLKKLNSDFESKIKEKKDKMKILNDEYKRLESIYKDKGDVYYTKYQHAIVELNQLKALIDKTSGNNQRGRNVVIETTLKEGETNRFEINTLDSNMMMSSNRVKDEHKEENNEEEIKNNSYIEDDNNINNNNEQCLTDYNEFSDDGQQHEDNINEELVEELHENREA